MVPVVTLKASGTTASYGSYSGNFLSLSEDGDQIFAYQGTLVSPNLIAAIQSDCADDALLEADETVIVTLSDPTNAVLGLNRVHTYTITNNDAASLAIAGATQAEGNEGITAFNFDITLTGAVDQPVTVDYATTDSTATTANLADGLLTLSVTLTDHFSNKSTPQTAKANLDTTPPIGTTVASVTNDTGKASDDGVTADNTLSFSELAEAGSTVEVFID